MAELKTKINDGDVKDFLNSVANEEKRKDCFTILNLMKTVTGEEAKMWGTSIIGFGSYHYKYASGREGDFMTIGFSPRKQNITLYIMGGFANYDKLMKKLGKHSTGKACLYIKKLDDINPEILKDLMKESVKYIKEKKWP